jgi:CRP/FNR family transcriptional regulator, anaerobic regulatory protein
MMKQTSVEAAWRKSGQCERCGFRALVLFADLRKADLDLIHLPISEVTLEAGSALYHAGEDAISLFTVRSGLVKLVRYLPDGAQRIVRLLKPGSTAGLEASLGHSYEHTALALRPTTVCRIPRSVVRRLMEETPRLHGQLMERWHGALQEADECLTDLSTGKASRRLARLLLRLVAPDGNAPLFSREDLGAILGITAEHASRTVTDLRRAGAITYVSGNDCRCNADRLYKLVEEGR